MNREIKFRVWDKQFSQWLEWASSVHNSCIGINEIFNQHNYFAFQQYTGLKTKIGEEIYEGDIINTKAARYEVVFRDGMFVAKWLMGIFNGERPDVPLIKIVDISFIIGNIFENPGFLKEYE